MEIEKIVVGQLRTNCYLIFDRQSKEGIIIDPGDNPNLIINRVCDLGVVPKHIVATHGHFDHILAVNPLKIRYQVPFLMHKGDHFLIERMNRSASYWLGENLNFGPPPSVDRFIEEGDRIYLGSEKLRVMATPGHSPGGVSLFAREPGILFSGDTIFKHGVGRTDFTYASKPELTGSIKKLVSLPDRTIVYPGHGSKTTIKNEKEYLLNLP